MEKGHLRQLQLGASRLELVVVAVIFAILAAWLTHTLSFYQELSEKTVVETTAMNMRTGLRFKIADLILKGEAGKQHNLARLNPVQFLEKPPVGYLGEMRTPGNLPPGSWYYEQDSAELVYIPRLKANLTMVEGNGPQVGLRWQVKVVEGEVGVQSVDVELLTPYNWF